MYKKKVTVVLPTLNEIDCIKDVLEELKQTTVDEILIVDGHSSDGTPELVGELGFEVLTQKGKGYGDAILEGVRHSQGDVIIPMDADGSYDPKGIPSLLQCIEDGYDVAFASRYMPESGSQDDTAIRYIGNMFFTFLLNKIHRVNLSDSLFLYTAAKREVYESLDLKSPGFEYCLEFPIKVHRAGFKYKEIPSIERKRFGGKTKVNAFFHGIRILWYTLKWKFKD